MTATAKTIEKTELEARLRPHNQLHLLRFWDELDASARGTLLEQIGRLDLEGLPGLIGEYVQGKAEPGERGEVAPSGEASADLNTQSAPALRPDPS